MSEKRQIVGHFDIDPSLVFELGERLITDEVQALIELVKNSYDADSSFCNVLIDTKATQISLLFPDAVGSIVVEDDGFGMREDIIRNGWLLISNRLKQITKARGELTRKGRTPLGNKGLGRLGALRLGQNLEIYTATVEQPTEYHVGFSWEDFVDVTRLTEVPVVFEETARTHIQTRSGTRLVISGLSNREIWSKNKLGDLINELSKLISPFEEIPDFIVVTTVNGRRVDLASISSDIRETSHIRYSINFDGRNFVIVGRARLDYIRPQRVSGRQYTLEEELSLFREHVLADNGAKFLGLLMKQNVARDLNLRKASRPDWFVEFEVSRPLQNFDKLQLVLEPGKNEKEKIANPGPFYGEVDYFSLDDAEVVERSVFDSKSQYREFIKNLSGIHVFRDGFGIRVADQDWLGLGQQFTGATSFYGLRPKNIIGYISLSAKENAELEETTNRERFVDNAYYKNFYTLLQFFVKTAERFQELLRRSWITYRSTLDVDQAHFGDITPTPEQLTIRLEKSLSKVKSTESLTDNITGRLQDIGKTTRHIASDKSNPGSQLAEQITESVEEAEVAFSQLKEVISELGQQEASTRILGDQVRILRDQLIEAHSTIALGLAAEALTHELLQIADRLNTITSDMREAFRKGKLSNKELKTYFQDVLAIVSTMRKQLARFDPALRYVREKRENIELVTFFREVIDYYFIRLQQKGISIEIIDTNSSNFILRINKGKLIQVFDNLVLNSEYWLTEDIRVGAIEVGAITLEADKPFVRVWDNGRGIDPAVEHSLFEPFVTMKGREKGRGLGLFVVQQLLDFEGCTISLLPQRNQFGRCFIFEFDFSRRLAIDGK